VLAECNQGRVFLAELAAARRWTIFRSREAATPPTDDPARSRRMSPPNVTRDANRPVKTRRRKPTSRPSSNGFTPTAYRTRERLARQVLAPHGSTCEFNAIGFRRPPRRDQTYVERLASPPSIERNSERDQATSVRQTTINSGHGLAHVARNASRFDGVDVSGLMSALQGSTAGSPKGFAIASTDRDVFAKRAQLTRNHASIDDALPRQVCEVSAPVLPAVRQGSMRRQPARRTTSESPQPLNVASNRRRQAHPSRPRRTSTGPVHACRRIRLHDHCAVETDPIHTAADDRFPTTPLQWPAQRAASRGVERPS